MCWHSESMDLTLILHSWNLSHLPDREVLKSQIYKCCHLGLGICVWYRDIHELVWILNINVRSTFDKIVCVQNQSERYNIWQIYVSQFSSEYNRDRQLEREDDLKQRSSPSGHQSPNVSSPSKSPQAGKFREPEAYSTGETKLGDSGELFRHYLRVCMGIFEQSSF